MAQTLRSTRSPEQARSHQTVRLGRGRHAVPGDEVCVMELASMLAGEPFSDHPRAVCPVLGALLRAYNDHIDDHRRQALYPLASLVVGTRSTREVEEARTRTMLDWCAQRAQERPLWKRRLRPIPLDLPPKGYYLHASTVIRCLPRRIGDAAHEEVMALAERLVEITPERALSDRPCAGREDPDTPSRPPARAASRCVASTTGRR
jgi:hypothetical protein